MRTRLGKLKLYGVTYYADFCLGEPVQLKGVVSSVVKDLNNAGKQLLARDAVYKTLREKYPCK